MSDLLARINQLLAEPAYNVDVLEDAREQIANLRDVVANLANSAVARTAELSDQARTITRLTGQIERLTQLLQLVGVMPWAIKAVLEEPTDAPT